MQTCSVFRLFSGVGRRAVVVVCNLVFLFGIVAMVHGTPGFIANAGTTFLNVYFNDGTLAPPVSPTVSPYAINQTISTIGPGTPGVGTPLLGYDPTFWLQTGTPTPAPYPGFVLANWTSPTFTSSGVTAQVNYQQANYYPGSNAAPSSGISPVGTSVSLNNPNNSTAELRLDWTTTYTYYGPAYTWSASTGVIIGTQITDPNNNLEICTTPGTTGGSAPSWPSSGALAGTTTSDGGVTWTVFNTYAPGLFLVSISGTVNSFANSFSGIAGLESFAINGAPVTPANTATLETGGDFAATGIPATLTAFTDNSLWAGATKYLYGFKPPTTTYFGTVTATIPSPQLLHNLDTIAVSGYLDVFVDPGSMNVVIPVVPVDLAITSYTNAPVVLFPAMVGTNYVLQESTNLNSGIWKEVTDGVAFTGGVLVTNAPRPKAFFRLQ